MDCFANKHPTRLMIIIAQEKKKKRKTENKQICIWKRLVKLDQLSWFVVAVVLLFYSFLAKKSQNETLLPKMRWANGNSMWFSFTPSISRLLSHALMCICVYNTSKWELCAKFIILPTTHFLSLLCLCLFIISVFTSLSSSSLSSRKFCVYLKREICHCN